MVKTASEMHVAPRIVVHCYQLLSIFVHVEHCFSLFPLLSIVVHCRPLLSIVVHCCPLLLFTVDIIDCLGVERERNQVFVQKNSVFSNGPFVKGGEYPPSSVKKFPLTFRDPIKRAPLCGANNGNNDNNVNTNMVTPCTM